MKVFVKNNSFYCNASYEEKDLPYNAGFFWNPILNLWETSSLKKAAGFYEYADSSLKDYINSRSVNLLSGKTSVVTPLTQRLDAYQIKGVEYLLERNRAYLAYEQGLGKTPMLITVLNSLMKRHFYLGRFLIIVPPFLISNWLNELNKWKLKDFKIKAILSGKDRVGKEDEIILFPDSLLQNMQSLSNLYEFDYDAFISDESHRLNNIDAKRTEAVLSNEGLVSKASRVYFSSGTPMRNRPMDLFACLDRLASNVIDFRNRFEYGLRYCDGKYISVSKTRKVFDVSGSSNEEELKEKLKDFMVVEKFDDHIKVDILETVRVLDGKVTKHVQSIEKVILKKQKIEDLVGSENLGDIAVYRRELSELKLPVAVEYLKNILEASSESIIVFGWHTDLLLGVSQALQKFGVGLIYGATSMKSRDKAAKNFQGGKTQVLVANIGCMVGLNLTQAKRGIFIESSWVPSDNDQAAKRIKRRGQNKSVLIEHLVLAGTLDEYVLRTVLDKKRTINKII